MTMIINIKITKNNKEDYKSEKADLDNENIPIKTLTNIKNNKKIKTKKYEIQLTKEQIDNILANEGKTNLVIYDNRLNIEIIYNLKIKRNKFIYFQCNRFPKCKGVLNFI